MIRRISVILMAILMLAAPLLARADVVYGTNAFFSENSDDMMQIGDMHYSDKRFAVNGPLGYTMPREEPGSEKGISTSCSYVRWDEEFFKFKNDTIVRISYVCNLNGKYWGLMNANHVYQPVGWLPMDELSILYAQADWEEENKDRLYEYTGRFDSLYATDRFVLRSGHNSGAGCARHLQPGRKHNQSGSCCDFYAAY